VSLSLALAVAPDIVNPVVVEMAEMVLNDMGHRGNIPATSLEEELGRIRRMTSGFTPSSTGNPRPPAQEKAHIRTIIQDGRLLTNAILDVVEETSSTTIPSSYDSTTVLPGIPRDSFTLEDQWPTLGAAALPVPTQTLVPGTMPVTNALPQGNEVYLDGIDPSQDPFTFGMEDLQWLDLV
jgi:hypothetical protein